MSSQKGLIETYKDYLPIASSTEVISLHEGNTPLIRLNNLPKLFDIPIEVYVKYEGLNPTGSFKDRGMTVAVTQALSKGYRSIICASTGNTSASASAYAARAGIKAFVIIPDGKIALGKLSQAMIKGSVVIQIKGNFDQGMELVKEITETSNIALVNSVNPYRLQGQKTAAFEVIEILGDAPDYHYLPVGNAGNISAYWMGYCEAMSVDSFCIQKARNDLTDYQCGKTIKASQCPVMMGYQAEHSAPLVYGHKIDNPETIATAIRIGNPQSWDMATMAVEESKGKFAICSDNEILKAQKLLAQSEGIFCEPASAISIAGLLKDVEKSIIPKGSKVVCTLTGHGLKDPNVAIEQVKGDINTVAPEFDAINDFISSHMDG